MYSPDKTYRYGISAEGLVKLNRQRFKGLSANAVLIEGSVVDLPDKPLNWSLWVGAAGGGVAW